MVYLTDLEFKETSSFIVVQVLQCIIISLLRCNAASSDSIVMCRTLSQLLLLLLLLRWTLDGDNIHENAENHISLLEKDTDGGSIDNTHVIQSILIIT